MTRSNDNASYSPAGERTSAIARSLSFVELIDLLEFSRLRLDPPTSVQSRRNHPVIGTQEWMLPGSPRGKRDPSDIYVCSTVDCLHDSLLPPDGALLDFSLSDPTPEARPRPGKRLRLFALARSERPAPPALPYLRVDLQSLIRKVIVPKEAPKELFELVERVVRARIWVDVQHGTAAAVRTR
jgi:hypothetical protein